MPGSMPSTVSFGRRSTSGSASLPSRHVASTEAWSANPAHPVGRDPLVDSRETRGDHRRTPRPSHARGGDHSPRSILFTARPCSQPCSPSQEAVMPKISKIGHVVLAVHDPATSAKFYVDKLGMELVNYYSDPEHGL